MTGNELIALFSIHVRGDIAHDFGRAGPVSDLISKNLVAYDHSRDGVTKLELTPRGRCFVEFVQGLDLPRQSWSMTE